MLRQAKRRLWEWVRCTRHNLLHLKRFRIGYGGNVWYVRDGDIKLTFPHYPYLAFADIEGYLRDGEWNIEPGMTVLDAGGCYGEFTLYASKRVGPSGRVLMLEPDPDNVAVASRIFAMNGGPPNIEVVTAGLWRRRGTLRFNAGHDAQSTIAGPDSPDDLSQIQIDVHSLSSLTEAYCLERLDFVKMDIEGAELEALASINDLPAAFKPRYAIASYHVVEGRPTAHALHAVFEAAGYRCTSGHPQHLTTWASPI